MGGAGRTHGPGQGRGGRKLTGGPRSVQRDLMDGVSGEKSAQVGGGDIDEAAAGGIGGPGEVGSDDAAGSGEEGIVRGGGFGGEDIDGGAGDAAGAEGVGEIAFHDERTARGVDQESGGFHEGEPPGIDDASGFRREGAMQTDDVAFGKDPIEGGVVDAGGRRNGGMATVGEDAHPEGLADAGDGLADLAEANNAEGESSQFDLGGKAVAVVGVAGPAAGTGIGGVEGGLIGQVQQEGEGMLGDGGGAVSGNIGDHKPAFFGGGEIDGIPAGGEDADVGQVGSLFDGGGAEDGLVQHDRFSGADPGEGVGRGGAVINRAVGQFLEGSPGEIAGVGGIGI